MSLLSNADLTKLLSAIVSLNSGTDLASLPNRTLNCVNSVIPNELAAFDGFDTEGFYDGSLWYSPEGIVPSDAVQHFAELVHEHPQFHNAVTTLDRQTYRMSDSLAKPVFQKTALYNEFYRLFGADSQILATMRVAPTTVVTCAVHRPKMDFSDEECELIGLLTPHLQAAFRNAKLIGQIDSERRYLNRAVAKGVVAINETNSIVFTSQLAELWLRKYFGDVWGSILPVPVREYVEAHRAVSNGVDYFRPAEPLIVSKGGEELKITVTFDTCEREVLIFLEERRPHTVNDFERAGVTRREAEILYWIGRGKTDAEIARLLTISPRTVQKHIEHIFTKMGVETRTAAVMRALETVGR